MKILLLTTASHSDSAYCNRLISIAKGFQKNSVDILVAGLGSNKLVSDAFKNEGIPFVLLSNNDNKYMRLGLGILRLLTQIRQYQYIFLGFNNSIILAIVLLFVNRRSVLIHERTEYPDLNGKKILYNRLCKHFDIILTISNAIKTYFIRNGIKEEKIYIFPMLVDPQRFEGNLLNNRNDRYIAYCGNMDGNKDGLFDLVDAFRLFHNKISDVPLYLIGDTKDQYHLQLLKDKVTGYGLQESVIFKGRVNRDEIPEYLVNASALVLARPDNYQARGGFPSKVGEYLATGMPVVLTRTGELDSYLKDNIDCFFVEPGDPNAFAEKLIYVFENYEYAKKVGASGKRKAYKEFIYIVQVKKLIGYLHSYKS